MKKLCVGFALLALAAGCSSGGSGAATPAPSVTQSAKSRVNMSFVPAASAKKVVVSVDGKSSPAMTIGNQPQTAMLPGNVAVSVDCQNQTSASATSSGSGFICTVLTLLPPGQHDISVEQLDLFNTLITDLNQFITLAAGSDFFGDFFGSSPAPVLSATPVALSSASSGT
jgi:hypothetical protein